MKNIFFFILLIISIFVLSCKSKSKSISEDYNSINLDAYHQSNNTTRLIYNSRDTIGTILIINKIIIPPENIKSILDTIKMQNYFIDVDKKSRTIEMIKK
jgi:hypothetical protein